MRVGDPFFTHTLFPVFLGVLLGAGFSCGIQVAHAPSLAAFCRVVANCDKTQAQHHDVAGSVTRLCVSDPLIMPVILGVRVWDGLFLREPRLRALIPL